MACECLALSGLFLPVLAECDDFGDRTHRITRKNGWRALRPINRRDLNENLDYFGQTVNVAAQGAYNFATKIGKLTAWVIVGKSPWSRQCDRRPSVSATMTKVCKSVSRELKGPCAPALKTHTAGPNRVSTSIRSSDGGLLVSQIR
jgi:hypothetical protein